MKKRVEVRQLLSEHMKGSRINSPALVHMREVAYAPVELREAPRDDAARIAAAEAKRARRATKKASAKPIAGEGRGG